MATSATNHRTTPTHDQLAGYLRCVIYDLFVLAKATDKLIEESDHGLTEVYKTAALVKLRSVYDFFYRPDVTDSIKLIMFNCYSPKKPTSISDEWDTWLNHQSINTYIVHLDVERVTKDSPQPKFNRGNRAILRTAVALMKDAREFVGSVLSNDEFAGLNGLGKRWWNQFNSVLNRLEVLIRPRQHKRKRAQTS